MALELESSGLTDAGPHREINEDSIGCFAPADPLAVQRKGFLYVVADGLGGHNAGEVASSCAVARMGEEYYSPSNQATSSSSARMDSGPKLKTRRLLRSSVVSRRTHPVASYCSGCWTAIARIT